MSTQTDVSQDSAQPRMVATGTGVRVGVGPGGAKIKGVLLSPFTHFCIDGVCSHADVFLIL